MYFLSLGVRRLILAATDHVVLDDVEVVDIAGPL